MKQGMNYQLGMPPELIFVFKINKIYTVDIDSVSMYLCILSFVFHILYTHSFYFHGAFLLFGPKLFHLVCGPGPSTLGRGDRYCRGTSWPGGFPRDVEIIWCNRKTRDLM